MVIRRNLLCIRQKSKLSEGELLLYEPYKNVLRNFLELATRPEAKDFDPVSKVFDGLLSAPPGIREYYEALLGVTSYYQHSKGGKGKYIEKKIASSFPTCSLDVQLSELPIWLEHPTIHRKKAIFTSNCLTPEEKSLLRRTPWDWIGEKDVTVDIGVILSEEEKTVVLAEVKNRVDSGGAAARREVLTSQKFGAIMDFLIFKNKIFRRELREFSLPELLEFFKVKRLKLYLGILFDKDGNPASLENDKKHGFYSSSKEGFTYLKEKLVSHQVPIKVDDLENLKIEFEIPDTSLRVSVEAIYGDNVPLKLFNKSLPVSELLLLRYDDIWLSLLTTIEERAFLLQYGRNFTTIVQKLTKQDENLRRELDELINSECEETLLIDLCDYLVGKYTDLFEDSLVPTGKDKKQYIGDIIQLLCACEV